MPTAAELFHRMQRDRVMRRRWNLNHAPRNVQVKPSTLRLSADAARAGAHLVKLEQP